MAGWKTSFLLGRPGAEYSFDYAPGVMPITRNQISADNRVLSGKLKSWIFRTEFTEITLNGTFFTMAQADLMSSLLTVTDTLLSFKVRDSFTLSGELDYVSGAGTTVPIQENSATLLSTALVAASSASSITITGVFSTAALTGTNYWYANGVDGAHGTYADATRIITLGLAMTPYAAAYVTYQYTGWLVKMNSINFTPQGGNVDITKYSDWQLIGA